MNGGSDPYKLQSVKGTLRCIHVNCFNRLRFLAEVSTKLQKCTFLDNLMTIPQEGTCNLDKLLHFFNLLFPISNTFVFGWFIL